MKKIILFATALMMVGCGFMQNSTSSNTSSNQQSAVSTQKTTQSSTAAMTAGQGAGTALQALYAQYKADGNKYDYKNLQNILNTVTLMANCEGLKENYKDNTYRKEFSKGLVASSLGLVTQNNVETVTNSLVDMIKTSDTVKNAETKVSETAAKAAESATTAASYANTAAQYAGAMSTLLSAFGGK